MIEAGGHPLAHRPSHLLNNRNHKPLHGLIGRALVAAVPAAELGVVVRDDDVQTGNHPHRARAAVAEPAVGVVWRVGPKPRPFAIHAVDPPQPAIAAEMISLVIGFVFRADRPLSGNHLRRLATGPRDGIRQRTGHGQRRMFSADELIAVPVAVTQVEQAEAGKIVKPSGVVTVKM